MPLRPLPCPVGPIGPCHALYGPHSPHRALHSPDITYVLCHALYGPEKVHTAPAMSYTAQIYHTAMSSPIWPRHSPYRPRMLYAAQRGSVQPWDALYSPRRSIRPQDTLHSFCSSPLQPLRYPVRPQHALYGPETPRKAPGTPYMVSACSIQVLGGPAQP